MDSAEDMVVSSSVTIAFGVIFCLLIVLVCYSGDYILFYVSSKYSHSLVLRAFVDSSTHAVIGGLCWALVESDRLLVNFQSWINCISCMFLAAIVDVDHFISAGSLDLQKAVTLQSRPPFHNSSLIVVILIVCLALRRYISGLTSFCLMFVCAWFSHHLRDANRHGLWFYPLGHTPALSFIFYVCCIIILAIAMQYVFLSSLPSRDIRNDELNVNVV